MAYSGFSSLARLPFCVCRENEDSPSKIAQYARKLKRPSSALSFKVKKTQFEKCNSVDRFFHSSDRERLLQLERQKTSESSMKECTFHPKMPSSRKHVRFSFCLTNNSNPFDESVGSGWLAQR